jgi:ubiquinone/menaquinone biosynthesis C-methylase UbiE
MNDSAQSFSIASEPPSYEQRVVQIYREDYAASYSSLYTVPWPRKHELNARNLDRILAALPARRPRWLDLACGQAWHFSQFPGRARMLGVDLSEPQLLRARKNAPYASFVRGDMSRMGFRDRAFDLVTNFWAGYCYLGTQDRIAGLLQRGVRWLRTGGYLYFEVLLPLDLDSFNRSKFSGQTGFLVTPQTSDSTQWQYDDSGGRHLMMSPPLEFFLNFLTPHFRQIEARHDLGFMIHLIATGKKLSEHPAAE